MKIFILLTMLFAHVIADYNLQGWLASAKQKDWWKQNVPDKLYRFDYIMALFMHSLSWTFMVMLPVFWFVSFEISVDLLVVFILNILYHMLVDTLKANLHMINLIQDQCYHLIQIVVTWYVFVFMVDIVKVL